jgi:hypothetical protein
VTEDHLTPTSPEAFPHNAATSYEKGTKLRKRYEVTKKIRSYEKGTKLGKRYEVTNMVRSYEKGMKLQKGTKLRKRYEDATK